NKVTVTLKGVSQRNPNDLVYYYQLNGFDSSWVKTSDPVISFNKLPPGDYKFTAYAKLGSFQSPPVYFNFAIDKPLSGKLWFQVLLILFLSVISWILLTVGNRLYQKYIQSRMANKLESEVAQKQQLTAQSISFAQHNYKELSDALRHKSKEKSLEYLTPIFLKEISQRIELLWKKEKITLGEFHQYFDDLLAGYSPGAKVYHKYSLEGFEISMPVAFQLLEIFSLYFFIGLYKSETAVFSLDSENKSNGQLLMRFYNITHDATIEKSSNYHFLKEAISEQRHPNLTVDVIENLEYGNMIIAELNTHNEN
ncbi:MAG TPA: triple tyrosine motif-containing protein, partial [Flavisolibacter sp.]